MAAGDGQYSDFQAIQTHGGQFIQYNIFDNLFEVTNKYRPPIMPIGRGAYGIVWYISVLFIIVIIFVVRFCLIVM